MHFTIFTRVIMILFMAALLSLTAAHHAEAQQTQTANLVPMWVKGQSAVYEATSDVQMRIESEMMPDPQTVNLSSEMRFSWTIVEASEDGGGVAELVINATRLDVETPSGTFAITPDSIQGDMPPEAAEEAQDMLADLLDKTVTVTINSDGSIDSIEGLDAFIEDEEKGNNRSSVRELVQLLVVPNIDQQMTPGATWSGEREHESSPMGVDMKLSYDDSYTWASLTQLAGVDVAVIDVEADVDANIEMPEDIPAEINMRMNVDETAHTSKIFYDLSRHEIVGRHVSESMRVVQEMNAMGRMVTTNIAITSKAKLLRTEETLPE